MTARMAVNATSALVNIRQHNLATTFESHVLRQKTLEISTFSGVFFFFDDKMT
jgi:hypothetical protein